MQVSQHRSITAQPGVDIEDVNLLLTLVRHLSSRDIAPLVERHETPANSAQCRAVLEQFREHGILSSTTDRSHGLWDNLTSPGFVSLSLAILREVAQVSPAIAYLLHVRGLSNWLDFSAGISLGNSTLSIDRSSPSGGRIMGVSLAGFPLSNHESQALTVAWGPLGPESQALLLDVEDQTSMWLPQWAPHSGWHMARTETTHLDTHTSKLHGLDELTVGLVGAGSPIDKHSANDGSIAHLPQDHVVQTFSAYGLGLLAISLGAAERALAQARRYARERTQGSLPIAQYDAVAELLEHAEQAIAIAEASMTALASVEEPRSRLQQVWRTRATVQPLLTAAGSDSLQAFGGIGYMRDMGAEKVLRDLNTLRRLGGSPQELTLRCAGFDLDGRAAHA